MDTPKYEPPAPDPQIALLQQQVQQQDINALSTGARQDTNRLALQYGMAQSGAGGAGGPMGFDLKDALTQQAHAGNIGAGIILSNQNFLDAAQKSLAGRTF